jgi:hypothetical protein
MVIEFAVIDDPEIFIFVGNRLMAGLDVDNAKSSHRQPDIAIEEKSVIIRAAMDDPLIHRSQRLSFSAPRPVGMEDSTNATHN